MDNREYRSADEVKEHLHELYNTKINELELLKTGLEELRRKEEERIEDAVREKVQQIEGIKNRYARMEEEFEIRVQNKAKEMVTEYCHELKQGVDKMKDALTNIKANMDKLIEIGEDKLAEYSESSQVFQDGRDYTGALNFSGNSVDLQIEEEFRKLLSVQDSRLESIASLVNKE